MSQAFDLAELTRRMQGAITALKQEFTGLRTGRASSALLEPIQIDAYGQSMSITQVGTITVPEPRLLAVQVWDRAMVGPVDKAIRESSLGLNPIVDGQLLRIPLPELNEQRRKELVKVAHRYAEEGRVAVRNVRRTGIDLVKKLLKDKAISEDDQKRHEQEIQKLTDKMIVEIDHLLQAKEKDIMHV